MERTLPTFSESWYRVADQRIALRPGVRLRRQYFRGEKWYVLEDPFSNQFFRLHPAAYAFVARLRRDRTVAEAWDECLRCDPDHAPGQEEALRLIAQLFFANLLQYENPGDSVRMFERYERRREREVRARWLSIMFLRIPLFDPDAWLNRGRGLIRLLFSPWFFLVWLGVTGWAVKTVVENFRRLHEQSQSVLAPDNLILLYAGLVIIKALHEFGHAAACKRFGGEVHTMGIMLLIFTPLPYVDATSSWGFRARWQRMLVGAAGMIVELFVAAIAVFIWNRTGAGTLHNLAYNMIFVASVSTVLFNANPLLRYDGYYLLSDLLGIPNLYQKSMQQLRYLLEKRLFGVKHATAVTPSRREAFWLSIYGVLGFGYRIVVFGGILLFVADRFLLIGLVMAGICLIGWVVAPLVKFVNYLATSPQLERNRPRAVAFTAGILGGLILLLQVIPMPHHFRAPGILEARQKSEIVNEAPGELIEILADEGAWVNAGSPLVRLENQELELQLRSARARLEHARTLHRAALQQNPADLAPLERRLQAVERQIARLERDQAHLTVIARHAGIWHAPEADGWIGRWLPRGTVLGIVLDAREFEFAASIRQNEVNSLFASEIRGAAVRVHGQAGDELGVEKMRILQVAREKLPSAALGWMGGGEVQIDVRDPEGRRSAEPFFELRGMLAPQSRVAFLHGRTGRIRFTLAPEPLLPRWWRRLRQLLQSRYQW